ncbi:MAG: aminotransferase class I/II-fold pyridoxal phosphate-dependent enzyme [Thermodesulfobacteriota bacterium]
MFAKRVGSRLKEQQESGLYRNPPVIEQSSGKYVRINGSWLINFASNDYLGLGSNPGLAEKVADKFKRYGSSSSSSRLVSGNYGIIQEAEEAFADYFGYECALFYPSGYQCNLGLISTLFEAGDRVFFDKHIHSSLVKGLQLSGAEYLGYRHNRTSHLYSRLEKYFRQPAGLITESLFSMDGDILDLHGITGVKQDYDLLSIVDEAHAFGVLGDKGKGIARSVADIAVGTLGKALGLFGAFVLLPRDFREYLLNFSSPLIYTTSLPPAHAAAALDVLEFIRGNDQGREHLLRMSTEMKQKLAAEGFRVNGDAQILSVLIGPEETASRISRELFDLGFFAFPARFPTVPMNRAILRISITAMHDKSDVSNFVDSLKEAYARTQSA